MLRNTLGNLTSYQANGKYLNLIKWYDFTVYRTDSWKCSAWPHKTNLCKHKTLIIIMWAVLIINDFDCDLPAFQPLCVRGRARKSSINDNNQSQRQTARGMWNVGCGGGRGSWHQNRGELEIKLKQLTQWQRQGEIKYSVEEKKKKKN